MQEGIQAKNQSSENNKRIAKNTLFLYVRMLLTMGVSLYTSRIILNTLGVEDYGIYNVVGGVVVMFSSINLTMSTAVQRFMNFEMGKHNTQKLNNVFNTSIIIHFVIAIFILILLETIGVWFLNYKMNIASERMNAANWVLQFSALSFAASVISVPYNAAIVANEKMKAFAMISIVEVSLKLLVVFSLTCFSFDKLKLYAVLIFMIALILRLVYGIYAKKHFEECNFKWHWDKKLFKEMMSFAGWNMIGVTSTLVRTEGINIVMNIFFGTVVNASMGIANRVRVSIQGFTNNFIMAINPQITKSYASGDTDYLLKLVFNGSRYAFYLLIFLTLPIIIETDYILKVWLKMVPEFTSIFIKLILITTIIESLSKTLIQAMFATGDIKKYQIIVGSITLLNLPFSMGLYYLGCPPYVAMIVGIMLAIVSLFIRLIMLKPMIDLSIKIFFKEVLFNVLPVCILAVILPIILHIYMPDGFMRFLSVGFSSVIAVATFTYSIGLTQYEKNLVINRLKKMTNK